MFNKIYKYICIYIFIFIFLLLLFVYITLYFLCFWLNNKIFQSFFSWLVCTRPSVLFRLPKRPNPYQSRPKALLGP